MGHVYRSGTEEEYTELSQLLQDIETYQRDVQNVKRKKEVDEKKIAEEMRASAMESLARKW